MVFSRFQSVLMGGFYPPFFLTKDSFSFPWQQGYLAVIDALIKDEPLTSDFWQEQSALIAPLHPTELTLMLLPLFVYYHDDRLTLKQQIDTFISVYSLSPAATEILYLFASAIAVSLRRQERKLIPQLIEYYPQFNLTSYLIWLQNKLLDGIPLNQLVKKFPKELDAKSYPFFLALFAVSDTPEMPHLALLRVSQTPLSMETIGLTSALFGAMGGMKKSPRLWQLNYLEMANEQGLMTKIKVLWQHWIGNLSGQLAYPIATPLVMQPRSSLQLISQQEYTDFPTLVTKDSQSG